MYETGPKTEERTFTELRRRVKAGRVLDGKTLQLLQNLRFSGRIFIVFHNGNVLKSGYEEGYFSRRLEDRLVP